jgi:hypothetical protein
MPAAGLAMVTGSGIASAKTPPPLLTGTCPTSGLVTFAAPGLSPSGAITNKPSEKSVATDTPTSGFCGTGAIKAKIVSATSPCWATLPVYSKTAPTGGILADGASSACDVNGDTAQGDDSISATDVKTAIKDQNYYDTTGSFASSGTSSIVAALNAKPVKLLNNGNKGLLTVTGAAEVIGGDCGSAVGFDITGTSGFVGANNVSVLICLTTDTHPDGSIGASVLGDFASGATVSTATIGGNSGITYSA